MTERQWRKNDENAKDAKIAWLFTLDTFYILRLMENKSQEKSEIIALF